MELTLRPMTVADEEMLYEWRRDQWVIHNSVAQTEPTREQHKAWMLERMFHPHYKVLMVELKGETVATCTLRVKGDRVVELAYMVHHAKRSLGIATQLAKDVGRFMAFFGFSVDVLIREENEPSIKVAKKAGFSEVASESEGFREFRRAP